MPRDLLERRTIVPQQSRLGAEPITGSVLLDNGLREPFDEIQPLEDAPAALRHLIEDRPFGKAVLSIRADHA
jgi:hypothetical protein